MRSIGLTCLVVTIAIASCVSQPEPWSGDLKTSDLLAEDDATGRGKGDLGPADVHGSNDALADSEVPLDASADLDIAIDISDDVDVVLPPDTTEASAPSSILPGSFSGVSSGNSFVLRPSPATPSIPLNVSFGDNWTLRRLPAGGK